MFYLLKNNRIIDSNKLKNQVDFVIEEDNVLYVEYWLGKKFLGSIKKQSENVWDLIENGDLLKIKQPKDSEEKYSFGEYKEPETTNYASYIKDAFPNKILAIYKPNSNGDYIKVWERENE